MDLRTGTIAIAYYMYLDIGLFHCALHCGYKVGIIKIHFLIINCYAARTDVVADMLFISMHNILELCKY